MEIDFRKKLVSKIQLAEKVVSVEYEGLHLICFDCGKFGHRKEVCSNSIRLSTKSVNANGSQTISEDEGVKVLLILPWCVMVNVWMRSQSGMYLEVGWASKN